MIAPTSTYRAAAGDEASSAAEEFPVTELDIAHGMCLLRLLPPAPTPPSVMLELVSCKESGRTGTDSAKVKTRLRRDRAVTNFEKTTALSQSVSFWAMHDLYWKFRTA